MKLLVDTSVWIDHFHKSEPLLYDMLMSAQVYSHVAVIGELACGSLSRRDDVLESLKRLPRFPMASFDEAMELIRQKRLWGRGLSWVDCQILASCLSTTGHLWTRDRRLQDAAALVEILLFKES